MHVYIHATEQPLYVALPRLVVISCTMLCLGSLVNPRMCTRKVGGGKRALPPPSFRVRMRGYGKMVWFARPLPEMVFQTRALEVLYAVLVSRGVASSVPLQSQNCTIFPEKQTLKSANYSSWQRDCKALCLCSGNPCNPLRIRYEHGISGVALRMKRPF